MCFVSTMASSARQNGFTQLELELRKAMAEALGRAGERLERAIREYRAVEGELNGANDDVARARLGEARSQVLKAHEWLIIQREAIGLRRHDVVDEHYALPFALPRLR
jgi:hypothetical protein